jgi:hypothetical protein
MGSYENARLDLLLVGQAEALAMSTRISEDDRYLINGLRSYSVGNRPARDDLGRETRSSLLSASANFYCLPDLIRERLAAMLTSHNFAT